MQKIDRNAILEKQAERINRYFERGLMTYSESRIELARLEIRRYQPIFVYCLSGSDYWNHYTIADSSDNVIGIFHKCIAGINAGKYEIDTTPGYNKRDIKRLYKEYR